MLEENPMKMIIAVIATVLTAPLMLPADADAQAPQNGSAFTITGHAGETQLLQVNGKSYVEIETLARLTQGTLSLKANRTTGRLAEKGPARHVNHHECCGAQWFGT
jgi:hypothetical protein